MMPNIRQNMKCAGIFRLKGTQQKAYGFLKIHKGKMCISLVGNIFVDPETNALIDTSKNFYIIGRLNIGFNIITKNFKMTNFHIQMANIPDVSYKLFSIDFFGLNISSPELTNCDQVFLNMDNLSHYLYTPKLSKKNHYKKTLSNVKFHNINYKITSSLTIYSLDDRSKFRKLEQRWINFCITSNDDDWNKYKNILPLAIDIRNFVRLMTRINVDITNLIESHNIKNGVQQSIYMNQPSDDKHNKYTSLMHQLNYINLGKNFNKIFETFMYKMINNNRVKSLIDAILLVNNNSQNVLDNGLIDCTNAIESYYSYKRFYSLRCKIKKLVNSIPRKLRDLIMGEINIKQYVSDIKNTRVYIVHGVAHGRILEGVDLSLACTLLKWLIYTKILLDIKVPITNIYNELYLFMGNINNKKNYTEYKY